MVGYSIKIDGKEVQKTFRKLRKKAENLKPVFDNIGSMLESSTIHNFEAGTNPDGKPWKHSLRAKKTDGKTLVDTSRLMDSIVSRASSESVEVGTNAIYAAIHQMGGKCGKGRKVNITARPFLGVSADDKREISDIFRFFLKGAMA